MSKKRFLIEFIKDTAAIIAGGAVFAAGLCVFAQPGGMLTGGASGIALVLNSLTGISVGVWIVIVNIPLFIASFFVCGRRYTLRTMYATVLFSAVIDLFSALVKFRFDDDPLLAVLYGGILCGIGMFIVMLRSIVTGGSDLLAYIIQRRRPGRSISSLLLIIDGAVVLLGAAVYRSANTALYSITLVMLLTLTLNTLLRGRSQGAVQFIFSDKPDDMRKLINYELGRGCTVFDARGGYDNTPRTMIMCALNLRESVILQRRVFEIDENAFVVTADANRICGNGFAYPEEGEIL